MKNKHYTVEIYLAKVGDPESYERPLGEVEVDAICIHEAVEKVMDRVHCTTGERFEPDENKKNTK